MNVYSEDLRKKIVEALRRGMGKRAKSLASAPQTSSFSGNGKTATEFFELSRGLTRFNMTHQGERNFIVNLLDRNGARVGMALTNEIGPFEGSKAVQIPKEDIYLLQVEASGPWTIQGE
jgi:hypothetical protein